MKGNYLNRQFLVVSGTNFSLFLILATWSFLPIFIVERGGNEADVGLVMGAVGVTSLGAIPILTPMMDRYGRKSFMVWGALTAGLSNLVFLAFSSYSPLMVFVRLLQGIGFAACFNACSTAVVDIVPARWRAQGIGFFAVSSSAGMAVGPLLGEQVMRNWGFDAYFGLLAIFGVIGFLLGGRFHEPAYSVDKKLVSGSFHTAWKGGHLPLMTLAAVFGSGYSAMINFFPLYAKSLHLRAGLFFAANGIALILTRLLLGKIAESTNRKRLILACLVGFGLMLVATPLARNLTHTVYLGLFFGLLQGIAYPSMMAKMVDRAPAHNRAVVVGLFTGSFGAGINISVFFWGLVASREGVPMMYIVAGCITFLATAAAAVLLAANSKPAT